MKNTEDANGGSLHRAGSEVRPEIGQLRCPKCAAMRYNVHASDLAKGNGEVTCSNCGHVRIIKTFSTAKQRTSPSATVGRGNAEAIPALPPGSQSETNDATRHPNTKLTHE